MNRIVIYIALVVLSSCRKDEKITPIVASPYTIEYPELMATYLPPIQIPNDNPMTKEGVELGRKLFFDTRLSADNTQACASCHIPAAAFSDTVAYSVGIDGLEGTRNAMPIINVGWMDQLFWDGRVLSVEDQAFQPVINPVEMHNTWSNAVAELQADAQYPYLFEQIFGTDLIDPSMVIRAIAQFERTLISGNSPFDKFIASNYTPGSSGWNEMDELAAYQGFSIFMDSNKGDCFHCHGDAFNPLWTDNLFHNNGLDAVVTDKGLGTVTGNPNDDGKFKTPTLRNLAFTAPFMHDGRFTTIDQVINHYSEGLVNSPTIDPLMKFVGQGGVQLDPTEKYYLKMFLLSLSDSSFVINPDFQDPW